jgi:hypothetical protein
MTDTEPLDPTAPVPPPRRASLRSVAALVCLVLAAVLTVPAVVGFWGQRTLLDTQRYVATVGPLAAEPAVQDAVVASITDSFKKNVDVGALVTSTFGPLFEDKAKLQQLVPIVQGAVDSFVTNAAQQLVRSDQFQTLWVQANSVLQEQAVRFIEGDTTVLKLVDNQVVLDTGPIIDLVKQKLVSSGLGIAASLTIPGTQRQIVIMTSDELAQARTIYGFAKPVATWLIGLVALLYVAAVLLARRRPRMVVAVGAALMITSFVLGFALAYGKVTITDSLKDTVFGSASTVFYATILNYLDDAWRALFVLGLVLALGGLLAGRNRAGTAVRTYVRQGLEETGASLAGPLGGAGAWVARRATALRWASVAVGAVVLFWGLAATATRVWGCAALVASLFALISLLVGAGTAADAGTEPEVSLAPAG